MPMNLFSFAIALPLLASLQQVPQPAQFDEDFERDFHSPSRELATGDLRQFKIQDSTQSFRWPVKVLSIGHTIASYQNYAGVSSAYFHHGLDIRADAGSDVLLARGGKIVNIENYVPGSPQYWEIAVLDEDGFVWQYHHVEKTDIPQEVFDAYQKGTEIKAGTKIGTVVYWPIVSFGERYNHIHLNILGKDKEFLNPFLFLEPLHDTSSPEIAKIGLLKNGEALKGNQVSGSYSLYAHVKDLVLSNVFVLPPNSIEIQIDEREPQTVWKFDSLPGVASEKQYVNQFYVQNLVCGNYQCRMPIFDLGFRTSSLSQVFPLTPGEHTVIVNVADDAGNTASQSFTWKVQ